MNKMKWKITIDFESDDGECPASVVTSLSRSWHGRHGCRPGVECIAMSLGDAMKMLLASGSIIGSASDDELSAAFADAWS